MRAIQEEVFFDESQITVWCKSNLHHPILQLCELGRITIFASNADVVYYNSHYQKPGIPWQRIPRVILLCLASLLPRYPCIIAMHISGSGCKPELFSLYASAHSTPAADEGFIG
jgi:hypothetical protein